MLSIRPWQVKEICVVFGNASTGEDISIVSTFVDTELTTQGNLACSLGINPEKSIASFISFDTKEYEFTLAPGETAIKKAKISIPKDMTWWMYNWCVGYQLNVKRAEDDKWVFFVVRRKVGLMEINITWDVYVFGQRDNIKYIYENNSIMILRILAWIIWLLLLYSIIKATKGKKTQVQTKPKKTK